MELYRMVTNGTNFIWPDNYSRGYINSDFLFS